MKTYRVWIEVEEYNPRTDEYEKIDNNHCPREFRKLEHAEDFAAHLQSISDAATDYVDWHAVCILKRLESTLQHWLPCKPFKRRRKASGD